MKKLILLSIFLSACGTRGLMISPEVDPRLQTLVSEFLSACQTFNHPCEKVKGSDMKILPGLYNPVEWMVLREDNSLFLIDENYWNSLSSFNQEYLVFHYLGTRALNLPISQNLLDFTNPQAPNEVDYNLNKNLMFSNLFN